MQPRLKGSKKWTHFPKEYLDQIRTVFLENFGTQIGAGELVVEGKIYAKEITLRVGYLQPGRLVQANFEVSVDYSTKEPDIVSTVHLCVDAAASMMMDYFENDGEVDFPFVWKEYPFNGKTIYLQYSTENSSLEAEANKFLGKSEAGLVEEEPETEDALEVAEVDKDLKVVEDDLGEEDPEDVDDGPRMFRKKKKKSIH